MTGKEKENILKILPENQDLFRASIQNLDREAVLRTLLWLKGKAPFPYPTSIHLNLTLRCTARCVHCKQWTWPRQGEFSPDQLKKIFNVFHSWGVQSITFGGGNPLLYPYMDLAFQLAQETNIKIGIISEGIDLSDQLVHLIQQNAKWIRFSLDGPDADIHDGIRNTPGLFARVIESIKRLQLPKSDLIIGLNCVVQKRNVGILSQMIDLAEKINLNKLFFKISHGEDPGQHFLLSTEEWQQFVRWLKETLKTRQTTVDTNLRELLQLTRTIFGEQDVAKGKPVQSFYRDQRIHCFTPLFFLTCDSQGNIYPCDYLQADTRLWSGKYHDMRQEFKLGNILESSDQVLEKLDLIFHRRIFNLPSDGFEECGSCTRFC